MSVRHRASTAFRGIALAAVMTGLGVPSSASATPVPVGPDLTVNGSFENPALAPGAWWVFSSIPGWTHAPRPGTTSSGIELMHLNVGPAAPGTGNQYAETDSDGPSRLSQLVATVAGTTYRLEFTYSPRPNTSAAQNHFSVSAGSESLVIGPLAGLPATSWTTGSLDFAGDGSAMEFAFLDLSPEEAPGNGYGALLDHVSVRALNSAPDCSGVTADPAELWPPNGKLRAVTLAGATDADGDALTLAITGVTQDEEVGDEPDAVAGDTADSVRLRAQRDGGGDGRVYAIAFEVTDAAGLTCAGTATVSVPHDQSGAPAVDSGQQHDSFGA